MHLEKMSHHKVDLSTIKRDVSVKFPDGIIRKVQATALDTCDLFANNIIAVQRTLPDYHPAYEAYYNIHTIVLVDDKETARIFGNLSTLTLRDIGIHPGLLIHLFVDSAPRLQP